MKTFERLFAIERLQNDDGVTTFRAALSSSRPVERAFGTEILEHSKSAVDMTRATRGLPLLLNHNPDANIGRATNIQLEGDVLRGTIEFDREDPLGALWHSKVERGFAGDLSISGRVDKIKRTDTDAGPVYRITRWQPVEVSAVSVPADPSVGVNRQEGTIMHDDVNDGGNVVNFEAGQISGREAGIKAERQRIAELGTYFATRKLKTEQVRDLERECVEKGYSIDRASRLYSDLVEAALEGDPMERSHQPPVQSETYGGSSFSEITRDEKDGWAQNFEDSLLLRTGYIRDKAEKAEAAKHAEFVHVPISEMARMYLQRSGVQVRGLTTRDAVGMALVHRNIGVGQTASDFTDILANVATKAAGVGYDETPETFRQWCRIGSLPDFKQAKRVMLSSFSGLDEVPDGANYQVGAFSDVGENIQAKEYAKNFVISRQALINDDTDSFTRIPEGMGRAAARKIGDVVYTTTLYGPAGVGVTLGQDSLALFHTTHSNLVTSGAAPSVTTLDTAFTSMATQTDPSGLATLGIVPSYLIVGHKLRATAQVLMGAMQDPAEGATTSFTATNPFRGSMEVVVDHRLDTNNADGWYLAAGPSMADTIEVAFLQGQESPTIRQEEQISRSGVTFLVRLDFAVAALDFRGLYYNDGVT